MARPSIENFYDLSQPAAKQQLYRELAPLSGVYEVKIVPRRELRSNQQNRWFHGVICRYLADYMCSQDYEVTTLDQAKEFLKDRFLRISIIDKKTGDIIGSRVRDTSELSKPEFADFCERCRALCSDFFHLYIPDPDPNWAVPPTAPARKRAHAV